MWGVSYWQTPTCWDSFFHRAHRDPRFRGWRSVDTPVCLGDSLPMSRKKPTEFKDRLRVALVGYDRRDVLNEIGKSKRAMTGWLNGQNEPLASTVADLCFALDISADWLLGLKQP